MPHEEKAITSFDSGGDSTPSSDCYKVMLGISAVNGSLSRGLGGEMGLGPSQFSAKNFSIPCSRSRLSKSGEVA